MEAARTYTHDDLLLMPEGDGNRYEIIDGELFVSPAPFRPHQVVVENLHLSLGAHVKADKLGRICLAPMDVIFSKTDVVEPDLLFVNAAQIKTVVDWVRVVPELAVEVLSPSSHRHDLVRKRALYERYGVGEYWVIDPEVQEVRIYRLVDGRYAHPLMLGERDRVTSALFPGWEMPVADLFAE